MAGARIVLGVSGGIAAYKVAILLRLLRERGHSVRVIPTRSALSFVGRATWEALSGQPVHTSVFDDAVAVEHVALGRAADLLVVAPATADVLARAAAGRADDLLTSTLLTVTCPVLFAPAMHTEMWDHPATVANVATLRARGAQVLEPAVGRLTGADSGPGRLPEPEDIAEAALALLGGARGRVRDLTGRRVVISAGGTREPIDPVRFLGNRSSGRQGLALAKAAAQRGAVVDLVCANVTLPSPSGVRVHRVESATELRSAVRDAARDADVVIMAAAVADFRPVSVPDVKIKKVEGIEPEPIRLVKNPDILAELVADPPRRDTVVVGFAAETGDEETVLELGRAKARRKGADLLAVNSVGAGRGFGDVPNAVTVLDATGRVVTRAGGTKEDVAHGLLDAVVALLADRAPDRAGEDVGGTR